MHRFERTNDPQKLHLPKKQVFKQKTFHTCLKEPITSSSHLAHPKENKLPKKYFILPPPPPPPRNFLHLLRKTIFQTEKIFPLIWRNQSSGPLAWPSKNKKGISNQKIHCTYLTKPIFHTQQKNILHIVEKSLYTCLKKKIFFPSQNNFLQGETKLIYSSTGKTA